MTTDANSFRTSTNGHWPVWQPVGMSRPYLNVILCLGSSVLGCACFRCLVCGGLLDALAAHCRVSAITMHHATST